MRYRRPKRAYPTLQAWRAANAVSQQDAAKFFDVSPSHWSNIESGARGMSRRLALRISTATNVPLESLLQIQRTA